MQHWAQLGPQQTEGRACIYTVGGQLQVDAALSAEQFRQSLRTASQQWQSQWACLLRMAVTCMPATSGRSGDDLRKLPWSCLALRPQDGVGPLPFVAILCGSMLKTVKTGQVDMPGVVRYAQPCCQTQLDNVLHCVLSDYASSAVGTKTISSVLRQRLPTWLWPPTRAASDLRI